MKKDQSFQQYLQDVWHGLQELQQFGVAVVGDTALLGKVMVVGGYELAHGHEAGRLTL